MSQLVRLNRYQGWSVEPCMHIISDQQVAEIRDRPADLLKAVVATHCAPCRQALSDLTRTALPDLSQATAAGTSLA